MYYVSYVYNIYVYFRNTWLDLGSSQENTPLTSAVSQTISDRQPQLTGAVSVGIARRHPLTHDTSIGSAQVTFQSISYRPISHREDGPPRHYIFRGCYRPPGSSSMVFVVPCCKFFVKILYKEVGSRELP